MNYWTLLSILALMVTMTRAYHKSPPPWSPTYTVSGYLTIPFAEINEKFDAYFDEGSGNSRIDYYDGMDKTFQLTKNGEFGKMLKIVPMTDETVFNQINCFAVSGSETDPVQVKKTLQSLIFLVTSFQDYSDVRLY